MPLTILNESLGAKAEELGWKECMLLKPIFLASGKDLNAIIENSAVESRSSELLAKACEKSGNFLVNPALCDDFPKNTHLIDFVMKGKGKAIEIPLHLLFDSHLTSRAKLIAQLRFFFGKAMKKNVRMVASVRAQDALDVKSPQEVMALLHIIGFTQAQSKKLVSE